MSSDRIDFTLPIPSGTIIEPVGKVVNIGNTSMKVLIEIYTEEVYAGKREKAIACTFTFVAIDENKQPV